MEEVVLGGLACATAGVFSNPFDVVKTRMQLQGELAAKGSYQVHYKNVFHATWTIAKVDGLRSLQKGLGAALAYQFVMNGARLGTYQYWVDQNWTKDEDGKPSFGKTLMAGAAAGTLGGIVGSPVYLVKTHLQSMASKSIAVGHQYQHQGTWHALQTIYGQHGVLGLWRGVGGAVPRLICGSASQLTSFAFFKQALAQEPSLQPFFQDRPVALTMTASLMTSFVVITFMAPFDVASTRLYNQPVGPSGQGLLYRGFMDCVMKIARKEGLLGFYKGVGAAYARVGPHSILSLCFWDLYREVYHGHLHVVGTGAGAPAPAPAPAPAAAPLRA